MSIDGEAGRGRAGRIIARAAAWTVLAGVLVLVVPTWWAQVRPPPGFPVADEQLQVAVQALPELPVVPDGGQAEEYEREHFGPPWYDVDGNGCDTRNDMLAHWLHEVVLDPVQPCLVVSGILDDPYTGQRIDFERGPDTSAAVQIDHVVALGDAWRKGADTWPAQVALAFANDPANLIAVDGDVNQDKGAADAASWLPPQEAFHCAYVVQQVLVKDAYGLGVSSAELGALTEQLQACPQAPAVAAPAGQHPGSTAGPGPSRTTGLARRATPTRRVRGSASSSRGRSLDIDADPRTGQQGQGYDGSGNGGGGYGPVGSAVLVTRVGLRACLHLIGPDVGPF